MPDFPRHLQLADQLLAVEAEMRRLGLWAAEAPDPAALDSVEPFCHDRLSLPQWLQFVFVPRMASLVEAGAELPAACGIRPLAEHALGRGRTDVHGLLRLLGDVDALLTEQAPGER
ncbi:MAG TPA: YqcC family protein [Pseudomonadales bacterium]|nr:YqcC family protein [Pseudomonadales bacterium]